MAVTSVTTMLNNSSSQYDVYGNAPGQSDSIVSPPNVQDKDHLQQYTLTDTRSTKMIGSDRFGGTGTSSLSSSADVNSTVVASNGVIDSGAINIDSRIASQSNSSSGDGSRYADFLPWHTGESNYKITLVSDTDGFIIINYNGRFAASVTSVEVVGGPLKERQLAWYSPLGAKMDLTAGSFSDFHTGYNYAVVDQNGLLVPDPNHEDSGLVKLPIQAGVPFAITLESLYHYPLANEGFGSAEGSMNLQWQFVSADVDIAVTSLKWPTKGGVDVEYAVNGGNLPSASTLALYWASGTTSDTKIGGPVYSTSIERAVGQYGPIHVSAAALGIPPAGARYLLAVADPNEAIEESDEKNNICALTYDPIIDFVGAKYDGDPSPDFLGRFFADPTNGASPITDQTLTIRLSDSLAALRPSLKVGSYAVHPKADGSAPWDGVTYQTDGFDPGKLDDTAFLVAQAVIGNQIIAEADSPRFRVLPLPDWYSALGEGTVTFDPESGRYTLKGYMGQLGSSTLFVVPDDVPIVGGRPLGATIGYGVIVAAPLDVAILAKVDAFAGIKLNVLDLPSLEYNLSTTIKVADGFTINATPQGTVDPTTLEMAGGFGMTVKISAKDTLSERTFFEGDKIVGVFLVNYGIKGSIAVVLNSQAQMIWNKDGFQFVGGGGSYIDFGPTTTLTGFANVGWFIPPKFLRPLLNFFQKRLPKYFPPGNLLPGLVLKSELVGTLDLRGRVDYSGSVSNPSKIFDATAESTIDLQFEESLEFFIGDVNLLGVFPPFSFQLYPTKLPKKFKLLG